MSGLAELEDMIRKVQSLEGFVERAAPAAGEALGAAIRADLDAGIDPGTGKPWAPTKDGQRPLQNASSAIQAKVVKKALIYTVTGHHFHHHRGARGGALPARKLLPQSLTPKHAEAVRAALKAAFVEATK